MHIIRYKKDLRVHDHLPLTQALSSQGPCIGLYIREPSVINYGDFSSFHHYWIQESLDDLHHQLDMLHIPLLLWYGEVIDIMTRIHNTIPITSIYSYEETGNGITFERDQLLNKRCRHNHIIRYETASNGVVRRLASRDQRSRIRNKRIVQTPIIPIPNVQSGQQEFFTSSPYRQLQQMAHNSITHYKRINKPSTRIYDHDIPGEQAGKKILDDFVYQRGWRYSFALSSPKESVFSSSRLSAYLTYGNLSQKQVYQSLIQRTIQLKTYTNTPLSDEKKQRLTQRHRSLRAWASRLHRRCHFIQKLESRPHIEYHNQNHGFDTIRTELNQEILERRYHGQTGIPLVDAGMRCLQATGWINFRMRAMITSFVCNTCLQPRQAIAHRLAKVFVDYEPGIHYSQLQMQSGTTGINIIRIYNPIKQQQDKDPQMDFIRRWIPEYDTPSYPSPMVDIVTANRHARTLLWSVNKYHVTKTESSKVYEALGSRKKGTKHSSKGSMQSLRKKIKTATLPSLFD